jgi:hypothetical protein
LTLFSLVEAFWPGGDMHRLAGFILFVDGNNDVPKSTRNASFVSQYIVLARYHGASDSNRAKEYCD